MEIVLIKLDKVKEAERMDYDFFDPNQKDIIESIKRNFKKDKLENVCLKVNTGKTAPRNSYPEQGIRIIKVKNVGGEGIKWKEHFYVTEEFYEKAENKSKVQIGDILMLCSAHNKSYIGITNRDIKIRRKEHFKNAYNIIKCNSTLLLDDIIAQYYTNKKVIPIYNFKSFYNHIAQIYDLQTIKKIKNISNKEEL